MGQEICAWQPIIKESYTAFPDVWRGSNTPFFGDEHPLGDAPPLAVPTFDIQLRCGRTRRRVVLCVGIIIRKEQSNRIAEACVHRAAADVAVVKEVPSARRSLHCAVRNTNLLCGSPQTG